MPLKDKGTGFAPLANVGRLVGLLELCDGRATGLPGMGCFYGRSGYGKTTAAVVATNTFNAVHIEAIPLGGVNALLKLIMGELGLTVKGNRSGSDMFLAVSAKLGDTGRSLIIDEADLLMKQERCIETIRQLHDKSGVPIILMGEETLPERLSTWERVHGRILSWVAAEPCTMEDIAVLASHYCRDIEVAPDLLEAIQVASKGSPRYVVTNLTLVSARARANAWRKMAMKDWGTAPFHSLEARRGIAGRHSVTPKSGRPN